MGGRCAMSSSTCCKMKALMILAMLAVSEGRRIERTSTPWLKAHEAASSRRAASKEASPSLDPVAPVDLPMDVLPNDPFNDLLESLSRIPVDPGAPANSPVDMLLNDPAFKEKFASMAGHMDEFALKMKKEVPSSLLKRAENMADEMSKLSTDSKSSADSSLPELMELMIADEDFQKHATAFADEMQKDVKLSADLQEYADKMQENANLNADLQESLEAAETLTKLSEEVGKVTLDPEFKQTLGRVSEALGSLLQDPEMLVQADSLAEYLESMKDSQDFDIPEKMSEEFDAMIANKQLKAKASAVISAMLKAEPRDSSESAVDDQLAEDQKTTTDETLKATKAATQEVLRAEVLAAIGSTPEDKTLEAEKETHPSFLEDKTLEAEKETHPSFLEEWSGEEKVIPLLAAIPLLAVQPSDAARVIQAKGLAGRNLVATTGQYAYQPAFRGWHGPSRSPGLQMKDLLSGSEEWAEDQPAGKQAKMVPFLTSANGIRSSMLPSLKSALQLQGGSTKMVVKDAGGKDVKRVDEVLILSFVLWYIGSFGTLALWYIGVPLRYLAGTAASGFAVTRIVVALVMKESLTPWQLILSVAEKVKKSKGTMLAAFDKGGATGLASSALEFSANNVKSAMKVCKRCTENVPMKSMKSGVNIVAAFAAALCAAIEVFELSAEALGLPFMKGMGGHHGVGIMVALHFFNALHTYFANRESFGEKLKLKLSMKSAMSIAAVFAAASSAGIEVFKIAVEDLGLPFLKGVGGHHGVGIMAILHQFTTLNELSEKRESLEEAKEKEKLKLTMKSGMNMMAAFAAASCAGIEVFALAVEDFGLSFLKGVGGHHGVGIMAVLHLLNALNELFEDRASLAEATGELKAKTA